jgi:hypothetical protein
MEEILNRLFPQPQYVSGLLGDESQIALQQARQQGLLGLAAGLLQAGGPSRQRTNIGQAIGAGLQAGQQAYRGALSEQIQGQQMAMKLAEQQRLQQQQRALQGIMPQLMTTGLQQAERAADPIGALLQTIEVGTTNQPMLNQQALNLARSFLSPKDFKDLVEGLTKQQELVTGPKPDIKVAGDAIYSVTGGQATQLVAPKPEKPTQFTGEAATIALSTFGTADPTKLSPEQLAQIPKLIQDQRMAVAAAGRPSVDVKVGEGAASLLLKSQIERVNATQTAADAAAQTLRTTAGLKPLIEEGVFSGPLSGQATVVARLASSLGVTGRNTQELLNRTSEAMQGLARLELQAAEAMRGQGAITENERSLIARAAGGNLAQFTSGEVKTLLNALEKTSQFTIGSHRRQVDALRKILPEEARPYADAFTTEYEIPKPSQAQSGRSRW